MGNLKPTNPEPNCKLPRAMAEIHRRAEPTVRFRGLLRTAPLAGAAFLFLWTFLSPQMLPAQAAAAPQSSHPASTKTSSTARTHPAVHHRATHHARPVRVTAAVPAPPPAPPKPNWPAEQPPSAAKITWDSHGLAIEASNSSLDRILDEVATDTGTKVQGLNQDERIFGNYGPGPARDVLSRLLDGSGYNVLMIGGRGDEPPQQIILSRSSPALPQPPNGAQNSNKDEESDAEDQPQPYAQPEQPTPLRSPFGEPRDRSPQEMQQEMLMRQQQIEQQRQQQQQNNPQN